MQSTSKTDNKENIYINLSVKELVEKALENNEGVLAANQALNVSTGKRTGRSPKDRFIVKEKNTENDIDWGTINQPFPEDKFENLWQRACHYIENKSHYVSHLHVGADPVDTLAVTVITELAWQNLFAKQLFIREKLSDKHESHGWTVLSAPNFQADPKIDGTNNEGAVILHLTKRRVLVAGIAYAGEIKKAMFAVLNYLSPKLDILPMHCSANVGKNGDVALFFGLSGTGKTTLSADPERNLIGDDEHGWSSKGVFNFEGGCYAKCINLSQKNEPLIWNAIKYGSVMENVVLNPKTNEPDYNDSSLTENTRVAYPREYIEHSVKENRATHPNAVIFLSCDLYGVLPPVALLTKEQAAYYFLSGYTALVGSTEVGQTSGIKSTFSTCFGAPFFPRPASVYADLLMKRIEETKAQVYLVNTGWTGGAYGVGSRFSIPTTRAVIHAILSGEVKKSEHENFSGFNFLIPKNLKDVESKLLNPRLSWQDQNEFEKAKKELIEKFIENFKRFQVADAVKSAGPSY